ncbi:MAG: bifunctional tRNA (5-methylaminomethyl-2-thiouridine)(34)-methyltransferase MnmD/FAD-dependent 5-carboxymethylaminomethyl-2-thiouridine(34) oxidoreductase MnmC [Robiginitomaculum sp.]|nr:MAG: bifunctional tRNA (5-methylaminomethyl-2-thiouridine)(34)-methyltransferase MnmD/FAD-dependent 5-carboxymethylaminomethyl-2-thiouridine(34) oxidoreductase MnmC [Robiginitomaculum sp.]
MTRQFLGLPTATLKWSETGEPEDVHTGDVYFSANDGLAETKAVFLAGCDLPARWQHNDLHSIGELGFGTGLNFMATLAEWRQFARPDQRLHYIAIEGAPLTPEQLSRAHEAFPELQREAGDLQQIWPDAVKGFHRRTLPGNANEPKVELTLLFGPVAEMLAQLDAGIDSWFLDGFAPAQNPQMWSEEVFAQLARLSRSGARLATYSVAGLVRRGLGAQGFDVSKLPGHGRKRQRLEAIYKEGPQTAQTQSEPSDAVPDTVIVIGGGIAGACLTHQFTQAGVGVTLIEAQGLAAGASGNELGLISPRLDLEDSALARFYRSAFVYAGQFYSHNCSAAFNPTGLVRQAATLEKAQKHCDLISNMALPEPLAKLADDGSSLFLKTGATLHPMAAIAQLTQSAKLIKARAKRLERKAGQWVVIGDHEQVIASAKILVLALGVGELDGVELPALRLLRGQVSIGTAGQHGVNVPMIGASYVLGLDADRLLFGATHDRVDDRDCNEIRPVDHQRNLANLQILRPDLAEQIELSQLTGRASVRAASPDLQPLAGPVADADKCGPWSKQFWGKLSDYSSAPVLDGLYLLNGLGSRGLTLAPLLAKLIVSEICGEPSPLERDARTAVHPARFCARAARRQ